MNFVQRKCPSCFTVFSVNDSDPSPLCSSCNHKQNADILDELEFEMFEKDMSAATEI
jgi:hypothetical protein